jgi:tetratricopeptide (TPR) repeat protein
MTEKSTGRRKDWKDWRSNAIDSRLPYSKSFLSSCLPVVFFCAAIGACAASAGDAFLRVKGQGDRAYSSGRYDEAASAYEDAARNAKRPRDRAEALYLEASAFVRARRVDRAREVFARLVAELPKSERAERARFDLADLEIDAGNVDRGYDLLYEAMMKHPGNGLAHRALERWIARLDERGGDVLGRLREIEPRLRETELDETVRYQIARRLEAASDLQGARDAYVACAERHPYPHGNLFDDALFHASLLDEKLGKVEEAILDLRRMLLVREPSTFAGSYERPRFSPAQFRIAVLYRDKLHDHASARREFHRLYATHPTSILRDDAVWEEAKLAKADGDERSACALTATLVQDFKDSRYVACAREICATAAASAAKCHPYLLRPEEGRVETDREPEGEETR